MSKKKLLEESTIRSFMKLANLQPLTDKFLKESAEEEESLKEETDEVNLEEELNEEAESEEHEEEEEEDEEEHGKKMKEELAPPADDRRPETGKQEEAKVEEGKESDGRPASPKQKVAGVAKPGKMDAAKNAPKDAKFKPLKQSSQHSVKSGNVKSSDEQGGKSNAPKKNNSQFDIVSESLEEMEQEMEQEVDDSPEMGSAGESGDHKEKMKGLIRDMLGKLSEMGNEYGMSMEISDEGAAGEEEAPAPEASAGGEEMGPPEEEAMMEEKLDEMVEKLTKRVAARLVKESKKKR